MNIYHVRHGSILPLGKQGENMARKIQFDISRWIGTFGPGTVQLLHQRSGDDAPYPVAVEKDGTQAIWTVTSADTAAPGTGHAELQYYVGDALAKSETWMTKVFPALGPAGETPPEAQQGWVDQVLQAGAAAVEAAEKAESAAVRQPYPNAETGTWWVWDAESGAYTDTGVSYGTGGGGTSDHEKMTGRDKADQHPISAITGLEDALAGKQPTGSYLTKETDPTVPDWAKEPTKPGYTASEVGADPSGTASSQVSAHNTGADTHSDIRLLIQGLTERLNALADSDDTTLDQLSEVVAYIKSNRSLIEDITTSKVSVADIVDNLTTNVATKPLSAARGVALKAMIDAINAVSIGAIPAPATSVVGQTIRVSAVDETGQPTEWEAVDFSSGGGSNLPTPTAEDAGKVPTVNADGTGYELGTVSGCGTSDWRLIKTIEITEEVASISFDLDDDGNPFEVESLLIYAGLTVKTSENSQFIVGMNNTEHSISSSNSFVGTTAKSIYWETHWAGLRVAVMGSSTYDFKNVASDASTVRLSDAALQKITSVKLMLQGTTTFTAGKFYIYGR